jgi:hypothetical protein
MVVRYPIGSGDRSPREPDPPPSKPGSPRPHSKGPILAHMKADESAVAAILAKVERAKDQFGCLYSKMDRWQQQEGCTLVPEVHAGGAKHWLRLVMAEPIPPLWSVLLGEAIHDLRSALDHTIYQLTIDYSGRVLSGTQFPIFSTRSRFANVSKRHPMGAPGGGLHMIRGVGAGPRAFIEQLQPYPQRRWRTNYSLGRLHEFWNQDKHRLVHLWGIRLKEAKVEMTGNLAFGPQPHCTIWVSPRVIRDKAIGIKIDCVPPNTHVKMQGQAVFTVAIKDPRRSPGGARSLSEMSRDTEAVVKTLLDALGHQDDAILALNTPVP